MNGTSGKITYPATKVMDLSLTEYLAMLMRRYERRTGRTDGFDVIRDTLATYGVKRFRELPQLEQLDALTIIAQTYDKAT